MLIIWKFPKRIASRTKCPLGPHGARVPRVWDPCFKGNSFSNAIQRAREFLSATVQGLMEWPLHRGCRIKSRFETICMCNQIKFIGELLFETQKVACVNPPCFSQKVDRCGIPRFPCFLINNSIWNSKLHKIYLHWIYCNVFRILNFRTTVTIIFHIKISTEHVQTTIITTSHDHYHDIYAFLQRNLNWTIVFELTCIA